MSYNAIEGIFVRRLVGAARTSSELAATASPSSRMTGSLSKDAVTYSSAKTVSHCWTPGAMT